MELRPDLKRIANVLTATRWIGALIFPLSGLIYGPAAVAGIGGWLLLVLWTTDLFDGRLARKSGLAGEGFFGRNDGWADLLLALGSFTLLAMVGFVNPWIYAVSFVAILVLCRVDFLVFQGLAVSFLTVFYFWIAISQNILFLVGIAAFFGLHAILSRERFVTLSRNFWNHIKSR